MNDKIQMGPVNLNVNNLEKVSKFYECLGLEAYAEEDKVILSMNNKPLVVLHKTTLSRRNEVGLYHLGLKVPTLDDFEACILHLRDEKIKISGTSTYPCLKSLYIADPENNGIELYVDLPYKSNCLNSSERTVMNPLNLKEVVEYCSKNSSPLPKDTIIGRIHLHVLQLEESEDYYHEHLGLHTSYAGKNDSYLSCDHHEDYLGLNTWLPGRPSSKDYLRPGLRNFAIRMESALFDTLYPLDKEQVHLIDPNHIHSTVFRGL